jgi:hypothetical protein
VTTSRYRVDHLPADLWLSLREGSERAGFPSTRLFIVWILAEYMREHPIPRLRPKEEA